MNRPTNFQTLWQKHQQNRHVASGITEGNRCSMLMGLTLGRGYEPRQNGIELSFSQITAANQAFRGSAVLERFYVKAEQLAFRLKAEWGPPDVNEPGRTALSSIRRITGVIFVRNAWHTRHGWTTDHIDLWNGLEMGTYRVEDRSEDSKDIVQRADTIWLWRIV